MHIFFSPASSLPFLIFEGEFSCLPHSVDDDIVTECVWMVHSTVNFSVDCHQGLVAVEKSADFELIRGYQVVAIVQDEMAWCDN